MEQTNEAIVQPAGGARLKKVEKKPFLIGGAVLAILLAAYLILCGYARSLDTFYPNTSLRGVDVGRLTVSQAAERIRQELPQKTLAFYLPLPDKTGDGSAAPEGETLYDTAPAAAVSFAELGLTGEMDYTAAVEFVFRAECRNTGFLTAGWNYLTHLFGWSCDADLPLEPDEALFQAKLSALAEQFSREQADASYTLTDDSILLTRESNGLRVSAVQLAEPVLTALTKASAESLLVNAEILPARGLTAQTLHDTLSGETKNAGYDAAADAITPEQIGAEFDVSKAQALLDGSQPGQSVTIPATIEYPHVTAEALKKVLFRDVLGECRTHVGGTAARITNVKLASSAFNGVVLNTGDVFSYNETVGQRTEAKGYQAAPAYVKGETVDEIGGGVCQPSSTLYLACLRGNLEITERYAHRYAPSYIAWGMDATVSWNGPDYKFTNNTNYPMKIVTTYAGGYLTVKLLGTNESGVRAKITNETLSTTPWETVYQDDATLKPGTEEVKVTPYTGYKVRTYRNLYSADGTLLSSAFEASSNYKVRNKVILRGPAAPVTEPEVPVVGPGEIPTEPSVPVVPTTPPVPEETAPAPEETPVPVVPDLTETPAA